MTYVNQDPSYQDPSTPLPDPPVVVHYQLSKKEALPALRWCAIHTPRMAVLSILGGLTTGSGLVQVLVRGPDSSVGLIWLCLGLYELVLFGLTALIAPRRGWAKTRAAGGPQSLAFSEAGVAVRSNAAEARSDWSLYTESFEIDRSYQLRLKSRRYVTVPKSAFASGWEEARFRNLLERHTVARLR